MPLRGLDISLGMCLSGVSIEKPGSDGAESMAVSLSGPLVLDGATGTPSTDAYVASPPDVPGCRLLTAPCSPVTAVVWGRCGLPAVGAGRLWAGSIDSAEFARSLGLRCHRAARKIWLLFPLWCCVSLQATLASPPRHGPPQVLQMGRRHLESRNSLNNG